MYRKPPNSSFRTHGGVVAVAVAATMSTWTDIDATAKCVTHVASFRVEDAVDLPACKMHPPIVVIVVSKRAYSILTLALV